MFSGMKVISPDRQLQGMRHAYTKYKACMHIADMHVILCHMHTAGMNSCAINNGECAYICTCLNYSAFIYYIATYLANTLA